MFALPRIADKIPRKWGNIQSIHLKTSESASLPIFNSLPEVEAKEDEIEMKEVEKGTEETANSKTASPAAKKTKDVLKAKGGKAGGRVSKSGAVQKLKK
jgi:ribosome biogenesis protein UTP30